MMATDPETILQGLLASAKHSVKKRNLKTIHELCKVRHEAGVLNFRTADIGKLLEKQGTLKAKALSNAQSKDYRVLIGAWSTFAGNPPSKKGAAKADDWVSRISDPVIRDMVLALRWEVERLKAERSHLHRHQQPVNVYRQEPQGSTSIVSASETLTPMEKEALGGVLNTEQLTNAGLKAGARGELVLIESGEILFQRGFVSGLKKLLA